MMSLDAKKAKRLSFAFFIFFCIPCCMYAFSLDEKVLPKDMEYRAVRLFKATRCLVCSGESLYESKSSFAAEMREFVRNKIANGYTDEEILGDLEHLYGEQILINIPYRGYAHLLWMLPSFVAIVTFLAMISKFHVIRSER